MAGSGTATGSIRNNAIGVSGFAGSGSLSGSGISVGASQNVVHTVTVDGNTIREIKGFAGIEVVANVDAVFNATLTNNNVALSSDALSNFALAAAYLLFGGAGTETGTACLDIRDNVLDASAAPFAGNAVFMDQISTVGQHNLPAYVGSGNGEFAFSCATGTASAGISTYLAGRGNTMTNGPFPLFGGGVDASIVCGVTGTGAGCP